MTNSNINNAASLIADFDPALSNLFLLQPFQRHNIVTALHSNLLQTNFAHLADRIAVSIRSAIDSEIVTL